jgi:hypothetical protein
MGASLPAVMDAPRSSPSAKHPQSQRDYFRQPFVASATKGCLGSVAAKRAQLSPGVPEHLHPPPPRLLPQVIGRQNSGRQQRIVTHRVQPGLALRNWRTSSGWTSRGSRINSVEQKGTNIYVRQNAGSVLPELPGLSAGPATTARGRILAGEARRDQAVPLLPRL